MHYFLIRILSLAAALLAICCILSGIPACDKDTILRHYDNALQVGGALARTPDAALQGIRVPGGDSYTGSYTAAYQNFSGRVSCMLSSTGGRAKLLFCSGSNAPKVLLKDNGTCTNTLTLPVGSSSVEIILIGYSGEIQITVS